MSIFTENVVWSGAALRDNLEYGLQRPTLENLSLSNEGLKISNSSLFGKTSYRYDFGRAGSVVDFRFTGTAFNKFRIKVADTIPDLNTAIYIGTDRDAFIGSVIDTVKYTVQPNAYSVVQNNSLSMSGTQSAATTLFENPAKVILNNALSGTYSVKANMNLVTDSDSLHNSGSMSFLELKTGTDTVQVQKYYAQIRSHIADLSSSGVPRDVSNNDIVLGENVAIYVDNVYQEDTSILTDGLFGGIKDVVNNPNLTEEIDDLKVVESKVDFEGRTLLDHNFVRILGLRSDYSLTGILADMRQGFYHQPKRANGYYTLRAPMAGVSADIISNDIKSYNFDTSKRAFVLAETNGHWKLQMLVPAGVHYYYFMADGTRYIDSNNPNSIEIASGLCSVLALSNAQYVEFNYQGEFSNVYLAGTFNDFNETSDRMIEGADASEILKVVFEEQTYCNNHPDWHKLEINFEKPTPIVGIRLSTDVPLRYNQRVRILLDEHPITKNEWKIQTADLQLSNIGISPCAAYQDELESTYVADPVSHFENTTDSIIASEDGTVEWHFIQNDPIDNRNVIVCTKLSIWSRLENLLLFKRLHKSLEILVPTTHVSKVTDFLVSDNEIAFRTSRETLTNIDGSWSINQVTLNAGLNTLQPSGVVGEESTYGESVHYMQNSIKSFVEPFNKSGIALNNVEIAGTLAGNLQYNPVNVLSVTDLGTTGTPLPSPPRFTRETFTRASDRLRVVILSIEINPLAVGVYYSHIVGMVSSFRLELYETEQDALDRVNILGYADSLGYGYQVLQPYIPVRQLITASGNIDVTADNIIVCFDEDAADVVLKIIPRANI